MTQAIILITACLAIWMITGNKPWSKYGHIVGLVGQPFWVYESWQQGQWGIFIVSLVFAISYAKGCFIHIIKPYIKRKRRECEILHR